MALLSGAIRIRRFSVSGAVPGDLRAKYEEAIRSHSFRELGESDLREEAVGWVTVEDIFDTELYPDRWLIDNTINLTMRVDTKNVPARILAHRCKKREEEIKERDGRERLSRHERADIKDAIKLELSKRVLPTIRTIEMSWDLKREELYLFACGEKVSETFKTLFEKTFDHKISPLFPYALVAKKFPDEKGADAVSSTWFAPGEGRSE